MTVVVIPPSVWLIPAFVAMLIRIQAAPEIRHSAQAELIQNVSPVGGMLIVGPIRLSALRVHATSAILAVMQGVQRVNTVSKTGLPVSHVETMGTVLRIIRFVIQMEQTPSALPALRMAIVAYLIRANVLMGAVVAATLITMEAVMLSTPIAFPTTIAGHALPVVTTKIVVLTYPSA